MLDLYLLPDYNLLLLAFLCGSGFRTYSHFLSPHMIELNQSAIIRL